MSKSDYTSRWEGGSRYEVLYLGSSYLTVFVVSPTKISIDVSLTVARTKREAPGNFIIKVNSHEGAGMWALSMRDSRSMLQYDEFLEDDLCHLLDEIVKEWGLRLIEMV